MRCIDLERIASHSDNGRNWSTPEQAKEKHSQLRILRAASKEAATTAVAPIA
jgi:hypothetical protein